MTQESPALEQEAELTGTDPGDQQQDQALSGENPASYPVLELSRSALGFFETATECGDPRLHDVELGNHAERELRDFGEIDVDTPFLADLGQTSLHIG